MLNVVMLSVIALLSLAGLFILVYFLGKTRGDRRELKTVLKSVLVRKASVNKFAHIRLKQSHC